VLLALLGAGGCGGGPAPRPGTATPQRPAATPGAQRSTATPGRRAAWTHDTLLRRIAGRRIAVGGRKVRVDPGTVVCGGVGPPAAKRNGRPAWTRFRCLQPTFPSGSVVGPDAVFVVQPTGARTFAITSARLTRY
jgi:hypothetical protein